MMKKVFIVLSALFVCAGLYAQPTPGPPSPAPSKGDLTAADVGVKDSPTMIEYVVGGLANSIVGNDTYRKTLENWVKDLQQKYNDPKRKLTAGQKKDAVFKDIMSIEAGKTAFVNGLASLAPGAFSIPAEAAKQVAQWATKAEVAYAVACAYNQKPNVADFKADLYQIFAGGDLVRDALSEVWNPTKDQLKEAGTKAVRSIFQNPKVQEKLYKALGEKMLKKMSSVGAAFGVGKAAKEVTDKVLTPIGAVKDAVGGYKEIQQLAKDARHYYYKLPNPSGIYTNASLGAVLDFKGDSVTVRPYRGYDSYKNTFEVNQWVVLGMGKYVRDGDDVTVTFGPVSWEKSNWNAKRPNTVDGQTPNYYDVEATFSNMVWQIEIGGDEFFYLRNGKRTGSEYKGEGYPTPGNDWGRIMGPFSFGEKSDPAANTSVKVTFNASGGSAPNPANKDLIIGSAYGELPAVSRSGYSFMGWHTEAKGGTLVGINTKVNNKNDHTLYAQWSANGVTVFFESTGGSRPNPTDKGITPGSPYGALPTVTKPGYKFDGWFTNNTGGTRIDAKTIVANSSNHMLYAHWSPDIAKVTFNANGGGAPNPADKTVTNGSAYGDMPAVSRPGYSLTGWFTQAKGGTAVYPSTKVSNNKDHTLYAQWSANGITVTFNANGGSAPNPADKGVSPGNTYGSLPTTSRNGYKFDGWYTQANGGTKVDARTTMTTANNHTLYAHWIADAPKPESKPAPKPASAPAPAPAPASAPKPESKPAPATYKIGDKGPAGGIVFATGKECSSGELGQVAWADAEKLAKGYGNGGKSDWRLPTKDELNAMYNNLQKSNKGGFKKESYWGKNGSNAYAQNFGAGNDNTSPNVGEKKWVRAVRSF